MKFLNEFQNVAKICMQKSGSKRLEISKTRIETKQDIKRRNEEVI
jgi:hypothetical protein